MRVTYTGDRAVRLKDGREVNPGDTVAVSTADGEALIPRADFKEAAPVKTPKKATEAPKTIAPAESPAPEDEEKGAS